MNKTKKKVLVPNPRSSANFLSSICYAWTIPIFKTGFNRDLETSDLYDVLDEHSSGRLGEEFSRQWNEQLKTGIPSLPRVILYCYKWEFLLYASLTLILDCGVRIVQPILLGMFISYFSPERGITRSQLYGCALGMILCALVGVVMTQSISMALMHLGLKIKVGCSSLIYRKSLKLSKSAVGTTTVGQVVNLLSNDVGRLERITSLTNYIFVGPMSTLIVTILIWKEIGPASLVGILIILSAIPLQFYLGKKISTFRTKTANTTDERMQRMSEIVSGVKVIKMYAWEKSFYKLIEIVRMREIKWISGSSYIRGVITSLSLFHTRFSLFCCILCYVSFGNQITAQKIFVVTSFYYLLSRSMTVYFPRAISHVAEFLVSTKRISRFLLHEETFKPIASSIGRPKDTCTRKSEISKLFVEHPAEEVTLLPLHTGDNVRQIKLKFDFTDASSRVTTPSDEAGDPLTEDWNRSDNYLDIVLENAISLDKVFVKWIPTNQDYNLSNISIDIKSGSFVAIVGPVGAGKTSLLNTILKELPCEKGSMDIYGEVSYSSQEPWLFNGTIRENILFGSKMDPTRYNKVLQKCALVRDLSSLPRGDKTLAGEAGCNLSGGQKARINLARAVYRQADIYLLDDPLSAVDAHVGRQLFEECMAGYLGGRTRLLVTHQLHYIREVDRILIMSNGCIVADGTYAQLENSNRDFRKLLLMQVHDEPENVHELEEDSEPRERLYSYKSDDSEDEGVREEGKSGAVAGYVYRAYAAAAGSWRPVLLVLLATIAAQLLASAADYWTSHWVNMEEVTNGQRQNVMQNISAYFTMNYESVLDTVTTEFSTSNVAINPPGSTEPPNATFFMTENSVSHLTSGPASTLDAEENLVNMSTGLVTTLASQHLNMSALNASRVGSNFCFQEFPRSYYVQIYSVIIGLVIVMAFTRSHLFFWAAMRASACLHRDLFRSLSCGSMRFFNTNPSGRILNRFSKDMGTVDEVLPVAMIDVLQIAAQIVGVYVIAVSVNFWLLVPVVFTVGVFIILRVYYISTSRSIYRLVGITLSPALSHLSASLQGVTTVRAFGNQRALEKEFDSLQNVHTSASYIGIATSRAFGFWLDSVCVLFIAIVILSFASTSMVFLGGNVGLVLTQVMTLTTILQYGLRISTQMENDMISVERILDYTDIEHEPPAVTEVDSKLPPCWPQNGRIQFIDVTLRYSPTKAPAIRNLSVTISCREKVGIVGRTGAGKTSIVNALFRLEYIEGAIEIDGIQTDRVGLETLRSKLSIIPQEPVLFSGSVRDNLDPFAEYTDDALWNALEQVEMKGAISELTGGLEAGVSEGGANFSVGQRQLFCLARALLRSNHILILDEATANVDHETDSLIQQTIRSRFADCTVLTIAHRLQTVMDSDKVLVMDMGRMVAYDHPYILLQDESGPFHAMARRYGLQRMEAFVTTAKASYEALQRRP